MILLHDIAPIITRWSSIKFELRTTIPFDWYEKNSVKNSKFVWRKKNPPRAQIFRYFGIKIQNNYSFEITGNKCRMVRGKSNGINLHFFCCNYSASNIQVSNFCESGIIFEKRPLNKKYLIFKSILEIYYGKAYP